MHILRRGIGFKRIFSLGAIGLVVNIQLSKAGAALADPDAGPSNLSEIGRGLYYFLLDSADTGTYGDLGYALTDTATNTVIYGRDDSIDTVFDQYQGTAGDAVPALAAGTNGGLPLQGGVIPNAAPGVASGLPILGTNATGMSYNGTVTFAVGLTINGGCLIADGAAIPLIISATGSNNPGVAINGNGSASGIQIDGGTTGPGTLVRGGFTSGAAVTFQAIGGDSPGMSIGGNGTGAGILVQGGDTGSGLDVRGGATSGNGIVATGNGGLAAVRINGGQGVGIDVETDNNWGIAISVNGDGNHGVGISTNGANAVPINLVAGGATSAGLAISTNNGPAISLSPFDGNGIDILPSVSSNPLAYGINVQGASNNTGQLAHAINLVPADLGSPVSPNFMAEFFLADSGTVYASAIPGSVVKEIASNAGGGGGDVTLAASQPNAVVFAQGIVVNQSQADQPAIFLLGNGAGAGMLIQGGATGPGIDVSGGFSGGSAVEISTGNTGHGIHITTGGSSWNGISIDGCRNAIDLYANGNAIYALSTSTDAVVCYAGGEGAALHLWGGFGVGDGIRIDTNNGHGISVVPRAAFAFVITSILTHGDNISVHQVQSLYVERAGGGTFAVNYDWGMGNSGFVTINWNATTSDLRNALLATTGAPADVTITGLGIELNPFILTFIADFTDWNQLSGDTTLTVPATYAVLAGGSNSPSGGSTSHAVALYGGPSGGSAWYGVAPAGYGMEVGGTNAGAYVHNTDGGTGMVITGANGLNIVGTNGYGVNIQAGGAANGLNIAAGSGGGHGVSVLGGEGGDAIHLLTNSTVGFGLNAIGGAGGMRGEAVVDGPGLYALGAGSGAGAHFLTQSGGSVGLLTEGNSGGMLARTNGTGAGVTFVGGGSAPGLFVIGGTTGSGIIAVGGTGSGGGDCHGMVLLGGEGANGMGLYVIGVNAGPGIRVDGGSTADGVHINAGSGGGANALALQSVGGAALSAVTNNGPAISANSSSGPGVLVVAASHGIQVQSAANGFDIYAAGNAIYAQSATTDGIVVYPGSTGVGLHLWGGQTSGEALRLDTNGSGPLVTGLAVPGSPVTLADNAITTSSIQDGAITDAKITVPAETTGSPTGILGVLLWIASRLGWRRVVDDKIGGTIKVYKADSTTVKTTSVYTSDSSKDDLGKAT